MNRVVGYSSTLKPEKAYSSSPLSERWYKLFIIISIEFASGSKVMMARDSNLIRYILTDTKEVVQSILDSVESDNEFSDDIIKRG